MHLWSFGFTASRFLTTKFEFFYSLVNAEICVTPYLIRFSGVGVAVEPMHIQLG